MLGSMASAASPPRGHEPYWPAQLVCAGVLGLYLMLPQHLTLGPTWIVPALAGTLLLGLAATTRHRRHDEPRALRVCALALVALISIGNGASIALLVEYLVSGEQIAGSTLVSAGAIVWLTNVATFSLWFWELDGGGPGPRSAEPVRHARDFLFLQDTDPALGRGTWRPGFIDYLYVSLTNASAFSPTDTMPLSPTAKALMAVEALCSLVTLGLVVARAVNVLGGVGALP